MPESEKVIAEALQNLENAIRELRATDSKIMERLNSCSESLVTVTVKLEMITRDMSPDQTGETLRTRLRLVEQDVSVLKEAQKSQGERKWQLWLALLASLTAFAVAAIGLVKH